MSRKRNRVLEQLFETPPLPSVKWKDVEALLVSLGANIQEGSGSRVRLSLNGVRATFHRPHPRKEMDKGADINAGITP